MICDKLSNLPLYRHLIQDSDIILSFLQTRDLNLLPDGRHDIPGTSAYVNVSDVTTRLPEDAPWESHNIYLDIHIPLRGEEVIEWVTTDQLRQSTGYQQDSDLEFYDDSLSGSPVLVLPGYFFLCLPHDAHKPLLCPQAPTTGRKAVFKIKALER